MKLINCKFLLIVHSYTALSVQTPCNFIHQSTQKIWGKFTLHTSHAAWRQTRNLVLYFLPRDGVLVVVVVGVWDRKVLEANGRELLDVLMSLLCKKYQKKKYIYIYWSFHCCEWESHVYISTGYKHKSAITLIFGSKMFCKIQWQKENVREYVSADFQRQQQFTVVENSKSKFHSHIMPVCSLDIIRS